jgi:hypothetical protein
MNELKQNNMQPYGDQSPGLSGLLNDYEWTIIDSIIQIFETVKLEAIKRGFKVKQNEIDVEIPVGLIKYLPILEYPNYTINVFVNNDIEEVAIGPEQFESYIKVYPVEE